MARNVGFKYPRYAATENVVRKNENQDTGTLTSDSILPIEKDDFLEFVKYANSFVTKHPSSRFDSKLAFCLDHTKNLLTGYTKWLANEGRNCSPEEKIRRLLDMWKQDTGKEQATEEGFIKIFDLDSSNGLNATVLQEIQNRINMVSSNLIEVKEHNYVVDKSSIDYRRIQSNPSLFILKEEEENNNLKDLIIGDEDFKEYFKDEDSFKEFLIFQKFQDSCCQDDEMIDDSEVEKAMAKFQQNKMKKEKLLALISAKSEIDNQLSIGTNNMEGANPSTSNGSVKRRQAPNPFNRQMSFKIAFVGDQMVGKTSIIKRIVHSHFDSLEKRTDCVDYTTFTCQLGSSLINLQLWDTFGHEGPKTVDPEYLKNSNAVVIMYDITEKQTFKSMNDWIRWAKRHIDSNCELMIIGNKYDLLEKGGAIENRVVTEQDGWQLARINSALWFETSAATGHNVKEAIDKMAERLESNFSSNLRRLQARRSNRSLGTVSERYKEKSCVIS